MEYNFTITAEGDFAEWLSMRSDSYVTELLQKDFQSKAKKVAKLPVKAIKDVATSCRLGQAGEQAVIDTLLPLFELDFKSSHSGDMIAKRNSKSVLVEVKNYTSLVPYKEVEKFYRDLECNTVTQAGLFISLKSQITKINKSIHFTKHNHQYIVFLVNPSKDTILSMISLLFDINEYRTVNNDNLIREIENLEELRNNIATLQTVLADSKSAFDKSMDSALRQITNLENKFAESIRNLTNNISSNEVITELPTVNITDFIVSRFPDSALAKNESHRAYLALFMKRFSLSGNFNIKNKTNIIWDKDHTANLLKTKTSVTLNKQECDVELTLKMLSQYNVKLDGDVMKIELLPRNYPLLDLLFTASKPVDLLSLPNIGGPEVLTHSLPVN